MYFNSFASSVNCKNAGRVALKDNSRLDILLNMYQENRYCFPKF